MVYKGIRSQTPSLLHVQELGDRMRAIVQNRIIEAIIDTVAHYVRVFCIALVVGACLASTGMAATLTGTVDTYVSMISRVLPGVEDAYESESQKANSLVEFGLPITRKFLWVFMAVPIVVGIGEQLVGKRLRNAKISVKLWGGLFACVFGPTTLFTVAFLDIEGNRMAGTAIVFFVNGFLLLNAVAGAFFLWLVSRANDALVAKYAGPTNESTA